MSNVAIQSLPSGAADARRLASLLGLPLQEITLHRFPDGEIRVTVGPAASTTIIYASLDQPNDKLIALLFAAEALRRAGTRRLVLLAPYLCYMRQDAAFGEGEAISQKAVGRLIAGIVDRVITVDAHLHRTPDIRAVFPGIEAENLSAMPAIANALRLDRDRPGNDRGRSGRGVPALGERSRRPARAGAHGCAENSPRRPLRRDRASPTRHSIAGRPVLLVDDIVSSGGTLIACAKALIAAGATAVDAVITHALFPPDMAVEVQRRRHSLHPLDFQRAAPHQCDPAR